MLSQDVRQYLSKADEGTRQAVAMLARHVEQLEDELRRLKDKPGD
jgi:hypothetical protein